MLPLWTLQRCTQWEPLHKNNYCAVNEYMNTCVVTKEIYVLVAEKTSPNFPGPYHQTSLRWAGFKAMKMSRANPVFHMPRVKIYKRHVKTYHAYLKSFPQNKLPLPLTCQLCDQKPWKEDLPTSYLIFLISLMWDDFSVKFSYILEVRPLGLEPWLHQDRSKVGLVSAT